MANKWKEKYQKKARETNHIETWIKEGESLIYKENHIAWRKCVKERTISKSYGKEIQKSLKIMKLLDQDFMEEAKTLFQKQKNSALEEYLIRNTIFLFSKKGPEFYLSTLDREPTKEELKEIKNKLLENQTYEENELSRKKELK